MAERERRQAPPYGGVFVPRTRVMERDDLRRAVWRMAHEVIEANAGVDEVVLVGLQTGGVPFARSIAEALTSITGEEMEVGSLDVAFY
ncbi:MAG: bifunctional pyr operon transcriptional regulator/uracil phosphoribosyltransferase, partial [Acidimicrobiales bacterium]|nr:bifunctional pyr operon transcriptional regulator/uracil phosphoribosyltransferase [Acidimicrobiales bacterium]